MINKWYRGHDGKQKATDNFGIIWLADNPEYAQLYADEYGGEGVVSVFYIDESKLNCADTYYNDNFDVYDPDMREVKEYQKEGYNCYTFPVEMGDTDVLALFDESAIVKVKPLKMKNIIKLTETEVKEIVTESVKKILLERRSLKSSQLHDILKQHGGVKSNPCFDLANMTDEDIVDIVKYEVIYNCKTERGLRNYAINKGFQLDNSDTVEYMKLNDGTYMIGILRGGAFDYTNSKGRTIKSGDFEQLCNKRDERQKNRNLNQYKWENNDAEDLFKNPFFRRKEGAWKDDDFRKEHIRNAMNK